MKSNDSAPDAPKPPEKTLRKRPGRFRRWLLRPAMWALACIALLVFVVHWGLQSDWAGQFFAGRAEIGLETLLDREVEIGEIHLKLLPLGIEVENFWMAGATPEDPAFVELSGLVIDARLIDIRRRSITLAEVRLVEPRADLDFYGGGVNNLPKLVKRATEGNKGVGFPIDLTIQHLAIEHGELTLQQHKMPLDLSAKGLEIELVGRSRFDLNGRLEVEELQITLPKANPVVGSVNLRVVADEEGVRLVDGKVEGPDLLAAIGGHVSWEEKEWVIEVDARGDTKFFQRLGYLKDQVEGPFTFKGGFAWSQRSWGFRTELDSIALQIFDRDITDLQTVVSGDRNGLRFDLEQAQYAGGTLAGSVNVETVKGNRSFEVDLIVDKLDLQTIFDDQKIPVEDLAGKVSGAFDYRFPFGEPREGQGWADLQIDPDFEKGVGFIPIEGSAPMIIEDGIIRTQAARLTGPFQRLEMGGFYDLETKRGEFVYNLESDRVERLAMAIPFESDEERLWLPTSGSGLLEGTLTLEPGRTSTFLQIDLTDVKAPGAEADRLQGAIEIGVDGISEMRFELLRSDAGLIVTGSAPIERQDGSLTDTPFSISVDAEGWPLAQAAPWLPFEVPIEGPVSGSIRIWGAPSNPTGQVRAKISPATFQEIEVEAVDLLMDFDPTWTQIDRISLQTGAGRLTLSGSLDRASENLDLELTSDPLRLTEPPFGDKIGGDIDGQVVVAGTIEGLLSDPRIQGELRADLLTLEGQTLSGDGSATVSASLAAGKLEVVGDLLGLLDIEGDGRLDESGLDLELAVRSQNLDELFFFTGGESEREFSGSFDGRVKIQSDFEDFESWRVSGELAQFEIRYQDIGLQNLEPVVVSMTPEGLDIESFFVGDPNGNSELFVSGNIRVDQEENLDLRVQSSLDADWLGLFLPDLGLRSGTFDLLAVVGGSPELPNINGQGKLSDGRVIIEGSPFAIDNLGGVLLFYPDQIVIDRVDATAAGGTLRAQGNIRAFQESGEIDYRIQVSATDLRAPFPENWLTRASGEIVLTSTDGGRQVRGAIDVEQALYVEDISLGLTQMMSGLFARDRLEVESSDDLSASTELNIAVTGPGALRVRNNLADLHGDLDFVVRGTVSNPVLFGSVEVERGGVFQFGGNDYEIQRGVVNFANPYRIEPIIDASARADIRQYDVTLNLSGTLDDLDTSFTSNPPLADIEIMSLLIGGEESLSNTGTGSGSEGDFAAQASTIIAGQAASLVTQRTGRLFGLDRFQVQPLTTSTGELSQTRITIGKQLSRDLYVTYSYDPDSTAQDIYRVEWNVRRGMTLVFTQNGSDSYSVDVRWEKSF